MSKTNKKYVKLVVLSTLAEPRALADISKEWFGNTGRLFQPQILKEITTAEKSGLFTLKKRVYEANIDKFLEIELQKIKLGESSVAKKYHDYLRFFYTKLGFFTRKVYLNPAVIKELTLGDRRKAEELDFGLLLQLPFILQYLKNKDEDLANIMVQVMGLEKYVKVVEKLEWKYYYLLKEEKRIEDWVESYNKLTELFGKLQKKKLNIFEDSIKSLRR